jgi:protoheme IX farnesyltransferase
VTSALIRLFRPRLALLNGVVAVCGYLLFPADTSAAQLCVLLSGVTLLAAAGSAFNQVIERDLDLKMVRTRLRPLPCGELKLHSVMAVATAALLAGFMLLAATGGYLPPLLAAVALSCYLAVYTPLKCRTAWAPVAGALCGALPPVIGWCAAGGSASDYRIIVLAGLLFLWQIPHVWLFQLRHADDFRGAGIHLMCEASGHKDFPGTFVVWLLALVAGTMLLPAFGIISPHATPWFAICVAPLALLAVMRSDRILYSYLNLFPLLVTLVLLVRK